MAYQVTFKEFLGEFETMCNCAATLSLDESILIESRRATSKG